MDRIILSFYETLAHLELEYDKKKFLINKSKQEYELQLFIRMELVQKEEVWKSLFLFLLSLLVLYCLFSIFNECIYLNAVQNYLKLS